MIDQNVPHQLRGHAEKVSTVLPLRRFLANQPKVRLVNQGGALEGVVGTFAAANGGVPAGATHCKPRG